MFRKRPNLGPFIVAVLGSSIIAVGAYLIFPYCNRAGYQGYNPTHDGHQTSLEFMTFIDSIGQFLNTYSAGIGAVATGLIAIFTVVLAFATRRIYQHTAASERAYMQLSHGSPPGLLIDPRAGIATVSVNVKNIGRTPARISDLFFDLAIHTLPSSPVYTLPPTHEEARAFLVPGGDINRTATFSGHPILFNAVMEDRVELWVYGYVDYRDIFGKRHRGGYMRRYSRFNPHIPSVIPGVRIERDNNLIFDPTPGYNYDRRRRKGEGNDWDDKD